jgi:hypothetical protein
MFQIAYRSEYISDIFHHPLHPTQNMNHFSFVQSIHTVNTTHPVSHQTLVAVSVIRETIAALQ